MQEEPSGGSRDLIVVLLAYLGFFIVQGLLLCAGQFYPQLIRAATLSFTLLYPFSLAVEYSFMGFVLVWVAFLVSAGLTVRVAFSGSASACRVVFGYFAVVHRLSFAIGLLGGLGVLGFVVAILFDRVLMQMMNYAIAAVVIGGYFGVVQRDLAVVCADRIQIRSSSTWRSKPNACVVCGNALRDVETLKDAAGRVWTLDHCGHLAHEECIRGWAIVGKRHVSPCCNEKLDAERIRGTNPWEAAAGAWTDLLDLLRNGLIFLPVYMLIRSAMARI